MEKSITLADPESPCVFEVLLRQITKNTDNGDFGVMSVRYVCSQKKERRVNLVVPLRVAEEVKDLLCVIVYTGVRKSEGNRDYYNVCTVAASRGKSIPNLAKKLRKPRPQELCSEVIVDSLSTFPDGTVFSCWDLQMVKLSGNKVPVVRYETEDLHTKNIKRGQLYLPTRCMSNVKPDSAYVIRFNGSKTSKNNRVYHDVEVLGCEEDLFVQDVEEEFPASQVM